jgi:hypothetical protein
MSKRVWLIMASFLLFAPLASAADVTVEHWAYTIKVLDNGSADIIIQASITPNTKPMSGLSIEVPSSKVKLLYDFEHTASFTGFTEEQKSLGDATQITLNFNNSVEVGKSWNGRFGFLAEGVAEKTDDSCVLSYTIKKPRVHTPSGDATVELTEDALQVKTLLPESYDIEKVTPKPFRTIFQYEHVSSTWRSEDIHDGDTINIHAKYSETLQLIVSLDRQIAQAEERINAAEAEGVNVAVAREHLAKAEEYVTAQALGEYYKGDLQGAQEFIDAARQELSMAEQALETAQVTSTVQETAVSEEQTPAAGAVITVIVFALLALYLRDRRV